MSWYNIEHLHSALKFITPNQQHNGDDYIIRKKRDAIYHAKMRYPERWSRR